MLEPSGLASKTDFDIFDKNRILQIAQEKAEDYKNADPFPHIVVDNLFLPEALETVLAHFPSPDYEEWRQQKDIPFQPRKQGRLDVDNLPMPLRYILYQFNSKPMLQFLEKLTGINNLVGDAHYLGGGLHQILPGGFLEVHTDFNKHPVNKLNRRLNLLVYLNKNWQDDYNGFLELWRPDMSECTKKVAPVFNRTVIFNTTEESFHGHPEPLKCPEGTTRKSLAFYYYTPEPAQLETPYRTTNWQFRPEGRSQYIEDNFQEKLAHIKHLEAVVNERDQQIAELQDKLQNAMQEKQALTSQREDMLEQTQRLQEWAASMEKELQSRQNTPSGVFDKFKKFVK